jgi:hypothetical protein
MARAGLYGRDLALTMLRALPRVCLANLKPNAKKKVSFLKIQKTSNQIFLIYLISK